MVIDAADASSRAVLSVADPDAFDGEDIDRDADAADADALVSDEETGVDGDVDGTGWLGAYVVAVVSDADECAGAGAAATAG